MVPTTLMTALRDRLSGLESAPLLSEPSIPQFSAGEFVDPYAGRISDVMARRQALMSALGHRRPPEMGGMRPGQAGIALLSALAAKLLGAQNSDINSGIGSFVNTSQGLADRRYQNDMQAFNQGMTADKFKLDSLGDEQQYYQGLRRDALGQYERDVERADRSNERMSDYMHQLERDKANREFKGSEADQRRKIDTFKLMYNNASPDGREVLALQALGDPVLAQAMGELNHSERLKVSQVGRNEVLNRNTEAKTETENAMRSPKVAKVQAEVQRILGGVQLDDARKQQILQRVQYYPLEYQNRAANILSQIEGRKNKALSLKQQQVNLSDLERLRKIVQGRIDAAGPLRQDPKDLAEMYRLNQMREDILNAKVYGALPPATPTGFIYNGAGFDMSALPKGKPATNQGGESERKAKSPKKAKPGQQIRPGVSFLGIDK